MKKLLPLLLIVPLLGGCNLATLSADATKYGPIIGKDLIRVANILVQAECSPALVPVSQSTVNVLNIVAPSSAAATKVTTVLNANTAVAAQLCPLYQSIKATVGAVPIGTPSQTILPGA